MIQHSKFSEAALEEAIIELLGQEGYPYVKGDAITREPGQVLLHADLRAFLAKQYAADHITPQEIEAVINQLEAYSAADLYESNKAIMKLVCDGFLLKREAHTQKDLYIQLIDYSGLVAFREPTLDQVPSIVALLKPGATRARVGLVFQGRSGNHPLGSAQRVIASPSSVNSLKLLS
jgi:type I restriction enzyme, R subunit